MFAADKIFAVRSIDAQEFFDKTFATISQEISDVNGIITEAQLSDDLTAAAEKLGVRIIAAE